MVATKNSIRTFILENTTTSCRAFWGLIYNLYFVLGCVSFYCTNFCNNMKLVANGEKPKTVSLSVHIALGLVAYLLPLLAVLVIHLIHRALKEKIENAKAVFGVELVVAIYKFLAILIFPVICLCMGNVLGDTPSLWMWIGVVGCFYSVLIGYIDPADYGISAFLGMCMGVLLNLNDKTGKFILIVAFTAANQISRKMEAREKDRRAVSSSSPDEKTRSL